MVELKELGLQSLKLNINNDIVESFIAKEGDYKSRGISLQILKNNEVIDTTGITVEFYAKPKDGQVYMVLANEVDATQGKYEIIYPNSILQSGIVKCEIRLVKSDQIISTKQFDLVVHSTMITDEIFEGIDVEPLVAILTEAARNEQERIENEIKRQQNNEIVESWIANPEQFYGKGLEFTWDGTRLGVRVEGESEYQYVDLKGPQGPKGDIGPQGPKGDQGKSLEFTWNGTQLGVRVEGEDEYQYVDLIGPKGDKGDKGDTGPEGPVGKSLEFHWDGTRLGVRVEGETEYQYMDLKGEKGDPGTVPLGTIQAYYATNSFYADYSASNNRITIRDKNGEIVGRIELV